MSQFAVIGLGLFGSTVSQELMTLGHSVLGVDINEKRVDALANELNYAVIADATDERALKDLNLAECDAVVVAIGEHLEASLLCVLHLKTHGIKNIWVKATSRSHHLILSRLGVARIIHPEEEMGIRVAQALNYPMVSQYMPLGNHYYVVEVEIADKLKGQTVSTLLEATEGPVHALTVRRRDQLVAPVDPGFMLENKDSLILAGSLSALRSLAPRLL